MNNKNKAVVIMDKKYPGFESLLDLIEEVDECGETYGFLGKANIPGEYQGTIRVIITYCDEE